MHLQYTRPTLIFLITWCLWSIPHAGARPAAYQVNIREGCRQRVAGGYLKVYDEKERVRTYIRALSDQIQTLKPLLEKSRKHAQNVAKDVTRSSFDADLASQRLEAETLVKNLESQISEAERLKQEAQKDYEKYMGEEASLRSVVSTVFVIKRTEDKPDGGYPLQLTYKSPCPKYRHVCPLPPKEARQLLQIKIDGTVPEECLRYAGLSAIR